MTWLELAILAGVGVVAGVVNTLAGGGSLLTLPALIFLGVPPAVANATNRVGVVFQTATATWRFRRAEVLDIGTALRLAPATCAGSIVGALLSTDLDDELFRRVIGAAMIVVIALMWLKPKQWLEGRDAAARAPGWTRQLTFFAIGVYGGFLQAGVGILLLIGLVLMTGADLVRGNAVKALLALVFTTPALAIFLIEDLVLWRPGLALALGSSVGAWIGAHMTVSWGPPFVRWALTITALASAAGLFGAF